MTEKKLGRVLRTGQESLVNNSQARRGQGRLRLLSAFVRLAAREGVDAVTYRSLAQEAGVTSGLASYHFPDRETLVREALSYAVAHAIDATRLGQPSSSLDEFADSLPSYVQEAPEEAIFQYELLVRGWRDPQVRSQIAAQYDQFIEATHAALVAAGIPGDRTLARLVFAVLDGMTIQQLANDEPEETRRVVQLLRQLLRTYYLAPFAAADHHDSQALEDRP